MKFCPHCGAPLEGSPKFCMHCGENLSSYHMNAKEDIPGISPEMSDVSSEMSDVSPEMTGASSGLPDAAPGRADTSTEKSGARSASPVEQQAQANQASSGPMPPKKGRETEEAEKAEEAQAAEKSGRLSRRIKFIVLAAAAAVIIIAAGIYSQSAGIGSQTASADASADTAANPAADADGADSASDADGTTTYSTSGGYPLLLTSADDDQICEQIAADYLDAFVEKIHLAEENSFGTWTQYWYQEGLGSLVFALSGPVFWEIEDDIYLGIYNETTCGFDFNGNIGIYYGHLEGIARSGSGIWISFYNIGESSASETNGHSNWVYEGEWSNDLPNGEGLSQEVNARHGDNEGSAFIYAIDINFTDGLADGTGVFRYFDIDDIDENDYDTGECEVTAVSGEFEVIRTNDDGFEVAAQCDGSGFSVDTLNRLSVVVTQ